MNQTHDCIFYGMSIPSILKSVPTSLSELIEFDYHYNQKHLEKLATKMLENDEKLSKLKAKNINTDFLNLF